MELVSSLWSCALYEVGKPAVRWDCFLHWKHCISFTCPGQSLLFTNYKQVRQSQRTKQNSHESHENVKKMKQKMNKRQILTQKSQKTWYQREWKRPWQKDERGRIRQHDYRGPGTPSSSSPPPLSFSYSPLSFLSEDEGWVKITRGPESQLLFKCNFFLCTAVPIKMLNYKTKKHLDWPHKDQQCNLSFHLLLSLQSFSLLRAAYTFYHNIDSSHASTLQRGWTVQNSHTTGKYSITNRNKSSKVWL